jgi:hypothetical protein
MTTALSISLLIAGLVLLTYGIASADSIESHVSRFFTGHFTDHATWLLIGGLVCSLIGVAGLMRGRRA